MEKQLLNLRKFLEDSGYQILTTITDDKISDKNTLNVYLSNKLSETAEVLGHEDPFETHYTTLQVEFNDTGKIKTYDEDLIVQDRDFFKRVSELVNTSPEAILDTVRQNAEWSFNNFIRSDFKDLPMDEWNELFGERADGLKVFCENIGETYIEEEDFTSIHFIVSVEQADEAVKLTYNVSDRDGSFDRKFFLEQHGDTLKEKFNEEQVQTIVNDVNNVINDHLFFNNQKMSFEEHEVATEYFGATDIEVNKVKTVKNDIGSYNCITSVVYQSDKYILNLEAEKQGDTYTVDMKSLNKDSKDNVAFKNKLHENIASPVIQENFNYSDIENQIKENIEKGIVSFKVENNRKNKGPDLSIDF